MSLSPEQHVFLSIATAFGRPIATVAAALHREVGDLLSKLRDPLSPGGKSSALRADQRHLQTPYFRRMDGR